MVNTDITRIEHALARMRIHTTRETCTRLAAYLDLLREANQRVNLSRDADAPDAVERIILDSLSPIAFDSLIPTGALVCDIGSGAGLPGIPLAIARPNIRLHAIESVAKKCAFIGSVCAWLDISCDIMNMRAEEYSAKHRAEADVCVCRAVSALPIILEYAAPMLKPSGILIAYKAEKSEEEIRASANALAHLNMRVIDVKNITIPGTNWNHKLIIASQISECPAGFPRRVGVAENKPL